jgi:glucose-6-phosphate 1-dehydrogenase
MTARPTPPPAPERQLVVAFGATGDLMERKLLPALYVAAAGLKREPPAFIVLGVARHPLTDAQFQDRAAAAIVSSKAARARSAGPWARRVLRYQSIGAGTAAEYRALAERVRQVESEFHLPGNRVLYVALPTEAFASTIRGIGGADLHHGPGTTRIVLEKPFGRDLATARALNALIDQYFAERDVFRIDHYLGKETVQNLLVFRFANMLFESVWNRDRIDSVEITVAESLGVAERAGYYDTVGALRDMVQSHLTQLLCLTAMEVPASLNADLVRNEKVKVLRSLAPIEADDVVLGQYAAGGVGGNQVRGYRAEDGVNARSRTETFVALRLRVQNWRWQGTEFLLRTGKRLPVRSTQIVVRFRKPPVWFFPRSDPTEVSPNTLTITLQPDEGFELGIEVKRPGHAIRVNTERLHFRYAEAFGPLADAYQTLLLDVFRGDQTLFVRADEVEESWRIYDRILRHPPRVQPYPSGTWGPKAADELARSAGNRWSNP